MNHRIKIRINIALILVIFFDVFSTVTVFAQEATPSSKLLSALPHSYAQAVQKAAPAVVNVYTIRHIPLSRHSDNFFAQSPRRYRLGSGVIMNKEGYILTNHHLIRLSKKVLVALDDGRRTQAKVIGMDPETDLAVLRINLNNLKPIKLADSDKIQVGDVVLAIGNPFGLGQTVTQGIISAMGRSMIGINELENYIQTDAAINPGNSGGALINTKGELIGINTAIYSRSGGFQGVGFAIPVNVALNVMTQIIKYGEVKRGWLGIEIRMLTAALARSMGSKQTSGVIITRVLPKSPADKQGLKKDDIIVKANNHRVRSARGFSTFVAQLNPGAMLHLIIYRDNKAIKISMKIGTRPPQTIIDERGRLPERKNQLRPGERQLFPRSE